MDRFENRRAAGRALAERLQELANDPDTLVLALPRGGAPVGFEIARALQLPLDVFIVRKLGVPGCEELAMGAIATGGVRVLNAEVIRRLGISESQIQKVAEREQRELGRRETEYRGDLPPQDYRGKRIILVDDGLATGATMRAAVAALRKAGAREIIAAIPVGAPDACERLRREADAVVCALKPEDFEAVGAWYHDFSQTTDQEVREWLAESLRIRSGGQYENDDNDGDHGRDNPHSGWRSGIGR